MAKSLERNEGEGGMIPPRKKDVWIGRKRRAGTKKCLRIIKEYDVFIGHSQRHPNEIGRP
jgi:hypothetical protein